MIDVCWHVSTCVLANVSVFAQWEFPCVKRKRSDSLPRHWVRLRRPHNSPVTAPTFASVLSELWLITVDTTSHTSNAHSEQMGDIAYSYEGSQMSVWSFCNTLSWPTHRYAAGQSLDSRFKSLLSHSQTRQQVATLQSVQFVYFQLSTTKSKSKI